MKDFSKELFGNDIHIVTKPTPEQVAKAVESAKREMQLQADFNKARMGIK